MTGQTNRYTLIVRPLAEFSRRNRFAENCNESPTWQSPHDLRGLWCPKNCDLIHYGFLISNCRSAFIGRQS